MTIPRNWHRRLCGKKFLWRKNGRQETRLVLDTTFGGGVIYAYGPRLCWRGEVTMADWMAWERDAEEIPA